MLLGKNIIVAHIGSGHHGDVIRKKYWAKGKSCPTAISLGQDPVLFETAGTNLSWGASEYGFAGWMRGAPVEVTKGVAAYGEKTREGSWSPEHKGEWFRSELRKAGVDVWFGVLGQGVVMDGQKVIGVVVLMALLAIFVV